jgi:hypothetical protein
VQNKPDHETLPQHEEGVSASGPRLPECQAQGATLDEALWAAALVTSPPHVASCHLSRFHARQEVLRSRRDTRQRDEASPSPLHGERILPRRTSRLGPLNPVGTRSTASPSSRLQLGTQWNASLPVLAGRLMERAGVRGESARRLPFAETPSALPHLILPSTLPPGAERENGRASVVHPTVCSVTGSGTRH